MRLLAGLLKDGRPRSPLELASIRRQQRDLEEGHRRGLVWDEQAARLAVEFYSLLRHWKGTRWAKKPLALEAWQEQAVVAPLFGWRGPDNLRRFRIGYIEVPRKNGKTTLAAGIALQGLMADGEDGAEVYAAATMRDQASIVFNDAKNCMGPALKASTKPFRNSLIYPRLNGSFRPLSSEADTLDGLNVSRAILDELHAHKERKLWDVITGATGARQQPLTVGITTAGCDRQTICWELHELSRGVLEGAPDHDDSWFTFIACADEKDDWESPETWRKANPNYGISVDPKDIADAAKRAKASGSAENDFRRKKLNQWVSGVSRWIDVKQWDACQSEAPGGLADKECFGAFDLGWRDDFAARALIFPERQIIVNPADEGAEPGRQFGQLDAAPIVTSKYRIRRAWCDVKLWIPEEGKRDLSKAPLSNWIAAGLVEVTGGNSTDIDALLIDAEECQSRYRLKQWSIDPNNARQFGQELLKRGFNVFEFLQNKRNYNEPCLEFERLVAAGLCGHDGQAVLRWMLGNVAIEADSRGLAMPAKHKSSDKIDGIVALLMAFGTAMFSQVDSGSVYETRGMIVL